MVRNIDGCAPFVSNIWKLRSSGFVPIAPGSFLMQAFGVDKSKVEAYAAADQLPVTEDFTGADVNGEYTQASFQSLPYLADGQQIFQGSITYKPEFKDESTMPGGGW